MLCWCWCARWRGTVLCWQECCRWGRLALDTGQPCTWLLATISLTNTAGYTHTRIVHSGHTQERQNCVWNPQSTEQLPYFFLHILTFSFIVIFLCIIIFYHHNDHHDVRKQMLATSQTKWKCLPIGAKAHKRIHKEYKINFIVCQWKGKKEWS